MKNIHHKKLMTMSGKWKIAVEVIIVEALSLGRNYETME